MRTMTQVVLLCSVLVCVVGVAKKIQATTILQPVSGSTDVIEAAGSPIDRTYDQTGLSSGFVSGTTHYGTYLSGNPTHNSLIGGFIWRATLSSMATIDYDLGGLNSISSLALWNGSDGIANFDLLIDDNAAFSSPAHVGNFSGSFPLDASAVEADVFTFAPTIGSHARLMVWGSHSAEASIGEVVFERHAPMIQPVSATTDMDTAPGSSIDFSRDQSGLSGGYVSGTTSMGLYLADEPTHESLINGFKWVANSGTTMGVIDYDLGSVMTIDAMTLWNGFDGIDNFDLLIDDNAAFTSPELLGSFKASFAGDPSAVIPDLFTFAPSVGSHVRLMVWDSYGSEASLGEVAFQKVVPLSITSPVPEPSSLLLLGLGALGLMHQTRRLRRRG